jgi:hypothetical protein
VQARLESGTEGEDTSSALDKGNIPAEDKAIDREPFQEETRVKASDSEMPLGVGPKRNRRPVDRTGKEKTQRNVEHRRN